MSLNLFKSNLIRYMSTEPDSSDDFAEYLTSQYDGAVKRGTDLLNAVPLQTGNTATMELILKGFFRMNNFKQSGTLNIQDWGPAFKAYWLGAQGGLFPPPAIPADGTIQNISSQVHLIINPGQWSTNITTPPTNSVKSFVDVLALAIVAHLMTVEGIIITTSLYPTAPTPLPWPGVRTWKGYQIPG